MTAWLHAAITFFAAFFAAATLGAGLRRVNASRRWLAFVDERRVQRWLVVAVVLAPLFVPLIPSRPGEAWRLPTKVWIAPSGVPAETLPSSRSAPGAIRLTEPVADRWVPAALVAYFAVAGLLWFCDVWKLAAFRRRTHFLRRQGAVVLLHGSDVADALSFRLGTHRYIVLGSGTLCDRDLRRAALRHEAVHLRSGDTDFAWLMALMRALAWALPPVRHWLRQVAELEEFACDETVSTRGNGFVRAYARGLLQAAETRLPAAGGGRPRLAAALGACGGGPLLARRIRMLLQPSFPRRPRRSWAFGTVFVAVIVGVAAFGRGTLVDGRVSRVRAQAVATRLLASEDLAIPVNEPVLRELNKLVGTPEGREYVRVSMERMEAYRPMVEAKMKQYRVPRALLAVPMVESAWQNLPPQPPFYGAGLWQFIKSTAEGYGISAEERMHPLKETDAAMRLLVANRLRFKSWALSLIAYNGGEGKLQDAIDHVGRDPWKIVEYGAESERGYLAKVFAAALVISDPDLVP